ncbi:MAG: rod shape-determining protein MreD [bacterium]|nr:rod shape-determining protein MreD [bacterium]
MMVLKKIIVFSLIVYLLILFQTSFLVHFVFLRYLPNLAVILVLFLSIREKPDEKTALIMSFVGGLLLDAFSAKPFGFYALIFLITSLIIKFLLKKYIRLEISRA